MRVTRRTRPSQIGCGPSAARRRLLHAQARVAPPALEARGQTSLADLSLVIQLDLFDAGEALTKPTRHTKGDRLENQVLVVVGSSQRG